MRVLLVSSYELGHQPLHVASPAAALRAAGHEVQCLDLSVDAWDPALLATADAVAFSVPMHTAMRLAVRAAERVREQRPTLPVCFYGLYAPLAREDTVSRTADAVFAGEYEPALLAWVDGLAAGDPPDQPTIRLGRGRERFEPPARELLPSLQRYAHLDDGGTHRLAGYTEASHGCAYACRHCPLPVVYGGQFRVVDRDVVLADIAQQVEAGASHITFGDPDFLNGPGHVLPIVRTLHQRFPHVTFDCTVKVEHILRDADRWPEIAASGCRFVVTAVECLNDRTLELLDKGHTAADAAAAVELLRRHGIEPRPTFLPFTPWSTVEDVADIFDFVLRHDLIGNVDPVQYTIRLLLPPGSLLLDRPEIVPHLGGYDAAKLSYSWSPAEPVTAALQAELARIAERDADAGEPPGATFLRMYRAVSAAAKRTPAISDAQILAGSTQGKPRLTEPWFC